MADEPVAGTFCWNELMTRDAAAAKAFYGSLFGWKMNDMPMGQGVYTLLRKGSKDAGGLMQIRPDMGEMPSHWLSYVLVENVDAAVRKAGALGARVHVPGMDIPNIGRFGIFEDPTGAEIAVFQPAMPAAKAKRAKPAVRKAKAKSKTRARRR